jgi:hypothetical protein
VKLAGGLILLALVLGGGAYAYSAYQQRAARIALEQQQQEEARIAEEARKAAREAEERGFASVDEMRTLRWRGFKTKAEYVEAQQREQAEARERQLAEERASELYRYMTTQPSELVAKVEYKCTSDPKREVQKIEFVADVLEEYARLSPNRVCAMFGGQAYDVRIYFRP